MDNHYTSTVYCRKIRKNDSISDFYVLNNDKLLYHLENHSLSTFDTVNKTIRVEDLKPPFRNLSKGIMNWSIFSPLIMKSMVIDTNKWNSKNADYEIQFHQTFIEIYLHKSFENKEIIIPNSPLIGSQELFIRINTKDSLLVKIVEILKVAPNPQITTFKFLNFDATLKNIQYDSILENHLGNYSAFVIDSVEYDVKKNYVIENGNIFPDSIPIFHSSGTLSQLKEIKANYVLVDFWFRGCVPCITASKILNKLHRKYLDNSDLKIIGINVSDTIYSVIVNYIERYNLEYEQYYTRDRIYKTSILKGYGYPLILFYDLYLRKVIYNVEGADENTEKELVDIIDATLKIRSKQ
jgi:thiol-disulfide isomerase/thioredoxin